jgi:hypothetical protein
MSTEESPDTGRETGARYWLRSSQGESTVAPAETTTEIEGEGNDSRTVEAEPPPSALPETGNVLALVVGSEQPPPPHDIIFGHSQGGKFRLGIGCYSDY